MAGSVSGDPPPPRRRRRRRERGRGGVRGSVGTSGKRRRACGPARLRQHLPIEPPVGLGPLAPRPRRRRPPEPRLQEVCPPGLRPRVFRQPAFRPQETRLPTLRPPELRPHPANGAHGAYVTDLLPRCPQAKVVQAAPGKSPSGPTPASERVESEGYPGARAIPCIQSRFSPQVNTKLLAPETP